MAEEELVDQMFNRVEPDPERVPMVEPPFTYKYELKAYVSNLLHNTRIGEEFQGVERKVLLNLFHNYTTDVWEIDDVEYIVVLYKLNRDDEGREWTSKVFDIKLNNGTHLQHSYPKAITAYPRANITTIHL